MVADTTKKVTIMDVLTVGDVIRPALFIAGVLGAFWLILPAGLFTGHITRVLLSGGALLLLDTLYFRHTKARWFGLHACANAVIVILCLKDLFAILLDPIRTLEISTTNPWPMSLVLMIHMYHVAFFPSLFTAFKGSRLYSIDWVHHGVMIGLGWPCCLLCEYGPLLNYTYFFVCGLPGGLDYAMLYACKHGWMLPITEKRINTFLNVWCRAPFLMGSVFGAYLQIHLDWAAGREVGTLKLASRVFVMAIQGWNAQYFMERVAGNYHVSIYRLAHPEATPRARTPIKNDKGGTAAVPSEFESEDHLLPGGTEALGFSRRVSMLGEVKIRSLKEGGS